MAASDELSESYLSWREASAGVQAAYERWEQASLPNRDTAFGGYLAALQREQHAARIYRQRIELLRKLVGPGTVSSSSLRAYAARPGRPQPRSGGA